MKPKKKYLYQRNPPEKYLIFFSNEKLTKMEPFDLRKPFKMIIIV